MLSKRFVSLKGIFFSSLLQYGDFLCPFVFQAALQVVSWPIFLLSSHLNPICWEGSKSTPPFPFIGKMRWGGGRWVVVSSKLNLNCKFRSSPQKIVLLNILIACILTKLLLIQNRSDYSGWGCLFLFFFTKKVFLNVKSYRRSLDSFKFESSSPLQNGVPASLFFLPRLPSRA